MVTVAAEIARKLLDLMISIIFDINNCVYFKIIRLSLSLHYTYLRLKSCFIKGSL